MGITRNHLEEENTYGSKDILYQITPLILTYNEAPNIARTLASLQWAKRVVVLDSGSTDQTEQLCKQFSNVDWYTRPFDSFKEQTEFGIYRTCIETEYVLALDADMRLSLEVAKEIFQSFLPGKYDGGIFSFRYCISGHPLAGSLYPPQIRLFRPKLINIMQIGHGHKFQLNGAIYQFNAPLFHDDRKSLEHWTTAQLQYSLKEMERIKGSTQLRWRDRLRKLGLMPLIIGPYAYVKAGGPFAGGAAARYAYERLLFECLLAHRNLTARLEHKAAKD